MTDEDKNFGGSLVLDFRKWWRHIKIIYYQIVMEQHGSVTAFGINNKTTQI